MSPETLESDSQRMRRDPWNYQEFMASLPLETQEMMVRAADLGLDMVERPRAINRRHAVSKEFPVPNEVRFFMEKIFLYKITRTISSTNFIQQILKLFDTHKSNRISLTTLRKITVLLCR